MCKLFCRRANFTVVEDSPAVTVLKLNIVVNLCIVSVGASKLNGWKGDWISLRFPSVFICIMLYDCFAMCKDEVFYSFCLYVAYLRQKFICSFSAKTPCQVNSEHAVLN